MFEKAAIVPTLPASDLARARRYYEEKLGLELEMEVFGGLYFKLGEGRILVYLTEAPRGGNTAVSIGIHDFDGVMREMRSRGIVFEEYDQPGLKTIDGVAEMDGVRSSWFVDSEGNVLALGDMEAIDRLMARAA
jgi:catechol 2,3-dioxygenase-like lactoylglutathione lyase family enzyme